MRDIPTKLTSKIEAEEIESLMRKAQKKQTNYNYTNIQAISTNEELLKFSLEIIILMSF